MDMFPSMTINEIMDSPIYLIKGCIMAKVELEKRKAERAQKAQREAGINKGVS